MADEKTVKVPCAAAGGECPIARLISESGGRLELKIDGVQASVKTLTDESRGHYQDTSRQHAEIADEFDKRDEHASLLGKLLSVMVGAVLLSLSAFVVLLSLLIIRGSSLQAQVDIGKGQFSIGQHQPKPN